MNRLWQLLVGRFIFKQFYLFYDMLNMMMNRIIVPIVMFLRQGYFTKLCLAIIYAVMISSAYMITTHSVRAATYEHKISALSAYYNYTETNNGAFFIKNEGPLFGANYFGKLRFEFGGTIAPDITIYGGSLQYTSAGTGSHDNASYFLTEIRLLTGYEKIIKPNHSFHVFSGFGYRYTGNYDGGKRTDTGSLAYDRENHIGYMPFGIKYNYNDDVWHISLGGEYDLLLIGAQHTHFEPLEVGQVDENNFRLIKFNLPGGPFKNQQSVGYGIKISLALGYKNIVFEPFFNYWDIADSQSVNYTLPCVGELNSSKDDIIKDSVCSGTNVSSDGNVTLSFTEPANTTIEVGAKIGYAF
ncbi:MAG: hypothetical protein ACR2NY_06590 [Alphaproteobacteria bacterium]